ncbi:MAG TPA: peptide chain release factor 3, partial [Solirubrobacterales bacterium]|nr:peptide chain release factor 3 [Solirubrobacterales bacterium]
MDSTDESATTVAAPGAGPTSFTGADPAAAEGATAERDPVLAEAARRRTFAIISHPDAGKTTLSEKLLLYAGAIEEAGSVKARRQRRTAASDWMEMERERGISISSAVLGFEYEGRAFNLLDTPGHRDFSEDTLRVLAAADSAVILLDGAKGVEDQTRKLFQVAHERRMPLITFINKFDRPALEPLELIDAIQSELGLLPTPVTWPVGSAERFRGVVDRRDGAFHRMQRTAGGATMGAEEQVAGLDEAAAAEPEGAVAADWDQAREEVSLLDADGADLDLDSYLRGESTPVFFGSALSNFGVRLLLEALIGLAPAPGPRPTVDGGARALTDPFSGLVFKVQGNLDPRHRDRLAFLRVCSGEFQRGMQVTNARSGQMMRTNYAHELFGRQRQTVDRAYP